MDKKPTFDYILHWKKITHGELGIFCPTEELVKELFEFLAKKGYKWADGAKLKNRINWSETSCYHPDSKNELKYSPISTYREGDYVVFHGFK